MQPRTEKSIPAAQTTLEIEYSRMASNENVEFQARFLDWRFRQRTAPYDANFGSVFPKAESGL
jgi:hypothetical protein